MRNKSYWFIAVLFFLFNKSLSSQNVEKQNPIIFLDFNLGGFASQSTGFLAGAELNYQLNKNLLSLAYVRRTEIDISPVVIGFVALPIFKNTENVDEIAVLYGCRLLRDGHSFSFSAGPSCNTYYYSAGTENSTWERANEFGLSFEGNVKWFKREKKRMRLYYVIPVGKPTSFGPNLGLRLSGNISKTSYIGFSLVGGMGWHKNYE